MDLEESDVGGAWGGGNEVVGDMFPEDKGKS